MSKYLLEPNKTMLDVRNTGQYEKKRAKNSFFSER